MPMRMAPSSASSDHRQAAIHAGVALRYRGGIGIFESAVLEVAQGRDTVFVGDQVLRLNRYFPAAVGCVDDVSGNSEAAGVAAQTLDDLQPFCHGGAEMVGAAHRVAVIQVIRTDLGAHEG